MSTICNTPIKFASLIWTCRAFIRYPAGEHESSFFYVLCPLLKGMVPVKDSIAHIAPTLLLPPDPSGHRTPRLSLYTILVVSIP